mgnify:CR=1 FL=1
MVPFPRHLQLLLLLSTEVTKDARFYWLLTVRVFGKIGTSGRSPHFWDDAADLWREIRQGATKAEALGVVFDIKWVPSHKSEVAVDQG